jgi:hypothetical protein
METGDNPRSKLMAFAAIRSAKSRDTFRVPERALRRPQFAIPYFAKLYAFFVRNSLVSIDEPLQCNDIGYGKGSFLSQCDKKVDF